MLLRDSFDPQLPQGTRIIGPVLAYLDPQGQMEALAEGAVKFQARGPADASQPPAFRADDDGLLSAAVHPDDCRDLGAAILRGCKALDFHGDAVGQLLDQLEAELL